MKFDGHINSITKYIPNQTITFGGLSKWMSAGGWRLGYAIIPKVMKNVY